MEEGSKADGKIICLEDICFFFFYFMCIFYLHFPYLLENTLEAD